MPVGVAVVGAVGDCVGVGIIGLLVGSLVTIATIAPVDSCVLVEYPLNCVASISMFDIASCTRP